MANTQVWLDGHSNHAQYHDDVLACSGLKDQFPAATWIEYGSHNGHTKIFIDSIRRNFDQFRDVIILEDDCFPAPQAIEQFRSSLEDIRNDPGIFSVYGHHFGTPDEGSETSAFQCWGWATTAAKLKPVFEEFERLWRMPEPDFIVHVDERLNQNVRQRMDLYPGRSESHLLETRFCYDAVFAFLAAEAGMVHRKTPQQTIFNFGIGPESGHFHHAVSVFTEPPYNMIEEDELVERFNLHHLRAPEPPPKPLKQPNAFSAFSRKIRRLMQR